MMVEMGVAAVVAVIIWKLSAVKPKGPVKKELCVDDVLKEADALLKFDPLADAKNRPQAVKPLLSVLLAIREKKAEEDLVQEESNRLREEKLGMRYDCAGAPMHGPWNGLGVVAAQLSYARAQAACQDIEAEMRLAQTQTDSLSGRIGRDNPHWKYTREGQEAAARELEKQAQAQAQSTLKTKLDTLSAYVDSPNYQGGIS